LHIVVKFLIFIESGVFDFFLNYIFNIKKMIKVIFIKKEKCNSTYAYNFIEISGHASYNSNISLPCAAISFLIQSVSGFLKLHNIEACQDDGDTCSFNLDKLKQFDPDLVDYFVFSLKLIARDFPDDINIIY